MPEALTATTVLILDCQATGPRPERDHLLEIGWAASRADETGGRQPPGTRSVLVRPAGEIDIPRRVSRVTGLSAGDLAEAVGRDAAWRMLYRRTRTVARRGRRGLCPTVIHFAAFELPFLKSLHAEFTAASPFPFQVVCTHAIAARLLPDLPRKGLRAVAGYLGFPLEEFRRSAAHVQATAWIWRALAARLESEHGLDGFEALCAWLARPRPPGPRRRTYPMDPRNRAALPDGPGVYRMLGRGDRLLYVGKALSLRRRVASYFRPGGAHAEHILEMLSQAFRVDCTAAPSGLEAALMEAEAIQTLRPPYNVVLKNTASRLVFLSADFRERAERAGRRHPLGPLPEGWVTDFLEGFGAGFASGFENGAEKLLASAAGDEAEAAGLPRGADLLLNRYGPWLKARSPLAAVLRLGSEIARRVAEAPQEPSGEPEGLPAGPEAKAAAGASPEAVAARLEHALAAAARLIRRGRWFRSLAEASIAWSPRGPEGSRPHRLEIRGGRVFPAGAAEAAAPAPPPPGSRRTALARADYDRLRVLTTELRRLLAEGRWVRVRLGNGRALDAQKLKRLLSRL